MKKVLFVLAVLLSISTGVFAQSLGVLSGLSLGNINNVTVVMPNANVRVCTVPTSTTSPCNTPTTIYQITGTGSCGSAIVGGVTTSNANGVYQVCAVSPGQYVVESSSNKFGVGRTVASVGGGSGGGSHPAAPLYAVQFNDGSGNFAGSADFLFQPAGSFYSSQLTIGATETGANVSISDGGGNKVDIGLPAAPGVIWVQNQVGNGSPGLATPVAIFADTENDRGGAAIGLEAVAYTGNPGVTGAQAIIARVSGNPASPGSEYDDISASNINTGTGSNQYGVNIGDVHGAFTESAALYIADQGTAAHDYAIKVEGGNTLLNGNLTVTGSVTCGSGCSGGGIANSTFTIGTTAIPANTCTAPATITMTGVLTSSVFEMTPASDISAVTGWGSSGGLKIVSWPTANTFNYRACNSTALSITPSSTVTFNIGAR